MGLSCDMELCWLESCRDHGDGWMDGENGAKVGPIDPFAFCSLLLLMLLATLYENTMKKEASVPFKQSW